MKGENSYETRTVTHFRNADICSGGQGAPICASYFNSVSVNDVKPIVYVNISGKTSLSWIGSFGEFISFDSGPGDNFINNWMLSLQCFQNFYTCAFFAFILQF